MIHSIQVDGQLIPLTPPSVQQDPSTNLFSANSMMLFIGPNGTGKTTLLNQIARSVLEPDLLNVEYKGDLSHLHVVSLTLSPFQKPDPGLQHKRLHLMFRDRIGTPILPAVEFLKTLASEFDLKAKAELMFDVSEESVYRDFQFVIFDPSARNRVTGPKKLVEAIQAAQKKQDEFRDARVAGGAPYGSAVYDAYMKSGRTRDKVLIDYLQQTLGDELTIHIRALALALPDAKDARRKALRSIVSKFGIELAQSVHVRGFEKKFGDCLQRWRELGSQLECVTDDPSLKKKRYRFGLDRLAQIQDVPLEGIATVSLAKTSSGMAALIAQFSLIDQAVSQIVAAHSRRKPDLLLLIDEGDVFLHVAWQQRYVKALDAYLASLRDRFGCIQVLMTTHSPVMMSDFPRDHIVRLIQPEGIDDTAPLAAWTWENRTEEVGLSFGAPLETIIRETGGAGTMGSFAQAAIDKIIDDIRAGVQVRQERIDMIDDPMLRRLLNASVMRSGS